MALVVAMGGLESAAAKSKKHHVRHDPADSIITRDYDGTPIIMKGFRMPRVERNEARPEAVPQGGKPKARAERPRPIPRGSSTYIPPPVPSPYGSSPPPPPLTQPPAVYRPPPINSFGDRVIDAIHAYPLEKGIGNNPTDQQMFIRQRANQ